MTAVEQVEHVGSAEARRHRWTVRDVERMVAAGVLGPEDRVELVDGELVEKVVIGGPHATCVNRLTTLLVLAGAGRYVVSVQNPVVLDGGSMPEPDLTVLRLRPTAPTALPRVEEAVVIVEVADSSAASDRRRKLPLYGRTGVPEVWLVDLVAGVLERHREPRPHGFALVERLVDGTVAPELAPDLELAVVDVLGG